MFDSPRLRSNYRILADCRSYESVVSYTRENSAAG